MCLIAFHWRPEGPLPLLLAANRDEFYTRPTVPMAWWDGERILAGRDLLAGGTWLGVAPEGRCAAITNYRNPRFTVPDRASRGQLPVRFLEGTQTAAAFLKELRKEADHFNPFNLLLFDGTELLGYESHPDRMQAFTPGIHAVSNGAFDDPWPKVQGIKAGLAAQGDDDVSLLALLADARLFEDDQLPGTGVPLELERALSPAFIRTSTYGTRVATILRLGREAVSVIEQRFSQDGPEGRSEFQFQRRG